MEIEIGTVVTIDIIAIIALIISGFAIYYTHQSTNAAKEQAQAALTANEQTIQLAVSNAVLHFTDRFFDLLKEVSHEETFEQKLLTDRSWAHQFWSLHASEFYFFHHGLLPTFMYSLWMVELAKLYVGANGEQIRASHRQYLATYSLNYQEMKEFYEELYDEATKHAEEAVRNKAIGAYITKWISTNRKTKLD